MYIGPYAISQALYLYRTPSRCYPALELDALELAALEPPMFDLVFQMSSFLRNLLCRSSATYMDSQSPVSTFKTLPAHEDILTYPITQQWYVSTYHNEINEVQMLKAANCAHVAIYFGPSGLKSDGLGAFDDCIELWAERCSEIGGRLKATLPLEPNVVVVQFAEEGFKIGEQPHLFEPKVAEQLTNGHYSYQMLKNGVQRTYLNLKGRPRIHVGTTLYVKPCLPTRNTSSLEKQVSNRSRGAGVRGYWWISAIKTSANAATKAKEAVMKNGK